jgi:hypothetical protein
LHHIPLKTNGLTLRVKDLAALLEESWPKFNTPQLIRILSMSVCALLLHLTAKYYTNYVCPKVGRHQVGERFCPVLVKRIYCVPVLCPVACEFSVYFGIMLGLWYRGWGEHSWELGALQTKSDGSMFRHMGH